MKADHGHPSGIPHGTMASLMLAVFTVSVGFGVVLPLLPYLIERFIGHEAQTFQISRNTGLLTGIYTLALFLFAPSWGRLSDRHGRRVVLLIGLAGFAATTLLFSFTESLWVIYVERFLSGMFAAAVVPVASAAITDLAASEEARARRLTFLSLAGISGFLVGPMLGVFIARFAARALTITEAVGSLIVPLAATALLALLAALAVARAVPRVTLQARLQTSAEVSEGKRAWLIPALLALAFIVSASVGVFEVGLALRGKQDLGLTPYQIATMFSECSLVMFVAQAVVFSPLIKPNSTRWLIPPALAVLAAGLYLVSWASDFALMLAVVGAVAASAGILSPILTYWVSSKAGNAQGAELGRQTAAASLGAAVGSAAGGVLFDIAFLPDAPFILMAVFTVLGVLLSLALPHGLDTPKAGISVHVPNDEIAPPRLPSGRIHGNT